jgi:hypothetical protein
MPFSEEGARRLKESVRDAALLTTSNLGGDFTTRLSYTWKKVRETLGKPYEDCSDDDLPIALAVLESLCGEKDAV